MITEGQNNAKQTDKGSGLSAGSFPPTIVSRKEKTYYERH